MNGTPPANAGDAGLIPGLGRVHMPWGSWAPAHTTTEHREPQLLNLTAANTEASMPRGPAPQQKKLLQWEASTLQWRVAPRSLQLEKAQGQQRRSSSAKNKLINK